MAVQRKKLRVLPNPWLHIDEKGRPAGLVRLEQPGNGTFVQGWVGASVATVTEVEPAKRVTVQGRVFEQKVGIHYLTFNHVDEPVTVDNSAYYRKRVVSGDLIAFDEAAALACGISGNNFIKPETLLEKMKSDAIKQFDAENGEGAFETLGDMADEENEIAEGVARAVAEANGEPPKPRDAEAAPSNAELQGITLPADGVERSVDIEAAPALEPLPAFTTESNYSRSLKSQKGSDE